MYLKKRWIKFKNSDYFEITVINSCSLILGLLAYYFFGEKVEILIAIITVGVTLSLGIRQTKSENDKLFRELFLQYNGEYMESFNDELIKIQKGIEVDDFDKLVIDYLNLCAEEYLRYSRGRIPDNVWDAWKKGMIYYMELPQIEAIIKKEKEQRGSYYGLFDHLDLKIN